MQPANQTPTPSSKWINQNNGKEVVVQAVLNQSATPRFGNDGAMVAYTEGKGAPKHKKLSDWHKHFSPKQEPKPLVEIPEEIKPTISPSDMSVSGDLKVITVRQPLMVYDPQDGNIRPYPSRSEDYREYHENCKWVYNPWTGLPRASEDVEEDPYGFEIQVLLDGEITE